MNKISGILTVLLLFCCIYAQNKPDQNKAEQILEKAKKAISKKVSVQDIKSFRIDTDESFHLSVAEKEIQGTKKNELNFILPDKILQKTVGDYSTNQQNSTYIFNGGKFSSKLDILVNGQRQDFSSMVGEKSLVSTLKRDTFLLLFPIMLDSSWYAPLTFNYAGTAQAKTGKAEVLEAVSSGKTTYRLFFDTETALLLMMTENWTDKENKAFENKYYFSDYQEKDGLLVATKTVVEKNGKVAEEKTLKNLKVNPSFKPNFFDVKE